MSECFEVWISLARASQKVRGTSMLEFGDQDSTRLRRTVFGCDAMLVNQLRMIGRNLRDLSGCYLRNATRPTGHQPYP